MKILSPESGFIAPPLHLWPSDAASCFSWLLTLILWDYIIVVNLAGVCATFGGRGASVFQIELQVLAKQDAKELAEAQGVCQGVASRSEHIPFLLCQGILVFC